jgi:hypothetical protein
LNRTDTMPANVAEVFAAYPPSVRAKLMAVRRLIFEVAATTKGVGPLQETLKMGRTRLSARRAKNRQRDQTRLEAFGAELLRRLFLLQDHADRYVPDFVRR